MFKITDLNGTVLCENAEKGNSLLVSAVPMDSPTYRFLEKGQQTKVKWRQGKSDMYGIIQRIK